MTIDGSTLETVDVGVKGSGPTRNTSLATQSMKPLPRTGAVKASQSMSIDLLLAISAAGATSALLLAERSSRLASGQPMGKTFVHKKSETTAKNGSRARAASTRGCHPW